MVYVIQVMLTACEQVQEVPSWSCSQAVSKPVWHIPLLCLQWKTPDDGKRNCPKHVKFYSKNKFEKLVHLVGLIIKIYHNARSPERQKTLCTFNQTCAFSNFDVLLTVHLSVFISVFNQLDAQNLFHNKFYFMPLHVSSTFAHHQEVKIALHRLWYHHTYSCDDTNHTYKCDDTRGCVMQFWPPDDEHMCSKHVEAWNKTFVKQILCISLVKYWNCVFSFI